MPELPEVQTIVNDLKAVGLIGSTITGAQVFWPRSIFQPAPHEFRQRIKGQTMADIWRRGKYIVIDFAGGDCLLIHLRMSGRLHLPSAGTVRSRHEHVILSIGNGRELRLHDTRKFGRLYLVEAAETILGRLGPEPLNKGFTVKFLGERLRSRKRQLKPLLLDQTVIAGLGNIYVDEALWEAKIHPCRTAASLSETEIKALHRAIPKVLRRGLRNLGTTLGTGLTTFYSVGRRKGRNRDQLKVFRRADLPCPRCRTTIRRIVVGQRGTHICTACQKP